MADPNSEQPLVCWQYQAASTTKIIIAADTATERFAEWAKGAEDVMIPALEAVVTKTGNKIPYSSREATDTTVTLTVPTITLPAHVPTTAQEWYLLLGSITDSAPDYIECLDTGLKDCVNLHFEQGGGTNEQIVDAVGAYCTGMVWTLMVGEPLVINESTYECRSIESKEGSVEYHVTNASIALTTSPTEREWDKPFIGIYEIKWDTGSANQTLGAQIVKFTSKHATASNKYNTTDKRRSLYPGVFDKHTVSFYAVCDDATQYEDLVGLTKVICTVKAYKADASDYILYTLTGLHCLRVKTRVELGGGYVLREIECEYGQLKVSFDDGVNYGAAYNK